MTSASADRPGAAVRVSGARKSFGGREVLGGVDFSIGRGEVVSLIGPSGAGKSTMLRCLTLLDTLDQGSISYGDLVVCSGDDGARYDRAAMRAARMRFGLVFQDYNLFPHRTVLQNVMDAPVVVQGRDRMEVESQARELIATLDLAEHADKVPCQLSGGQQQRVAIARALCMNPDVMYFDEATSALDPRLTKDMHDLIRQLADKGMAVGIVTHEMGFAQTVSDRVCLLFDGQIVEDGSPEQLLEHPRDERSRIFLSLSAD
ncbi:amino acid ABC transporter ATP-binding protein [Thermophilibacter immobilis]|uniref:Amino acid ABC transporter ATP-binding protein n=1 Tax=Thermophilibacter immobilis TaxID=2779519 RepID=A0A7S7M933_9ACTN|nr:amino acid ABC transporter ATP-binding protein [Thermophilibacter immobilis]QOY60883.1 amino acid ABC transporter ATP-binding protein [Thermophilibacter immobilis]